MNYTERVARRLLTARKSPEDSSIDCTQDGKPWLVTAEDCRVLAKAYLDGLRPEGGSRDLVLSAIDREPELPGEPPQEMVDAIVKAVRDTDTPLLAETLRIVVRLTKQGIRERYLAALEPQ